jgi:hypothetical protein
MDNAEVRSTHPDEVLAALCAQELDRPRQQARGRKLTLAACACCRRLGPLLADARTRAALEASERFADRLAAWADLELAKGEAAAARSEAPNPWASEARWAVWAAVWSVTHPELWGPQAIGAARAARRLEAGYDGRDFRVAERREAKAQLAILRDVFADRPAWVDPGWLRWGGGTVVRVAEAVYEDGRFADLPVLADALEEAGCTDEAVLAHCRGPGPHVRGCWVVDAVLGRG